MHLAARYQARVAAALGACLFALYAAPAGADPAPGWWDSHPPAEKKVITNMAYFLATQGITPYLGDAASRATPIVRDVYEAKPHELEYAELTEQSLGLLEDAGLIPKITGPAGVVKSIFSKVSAGILAFQVGLLIGDDINKKFLRIGLSEAPIPEGGFSDFDFAHGSLTFYPKGTSIYFGADVQEDSFLFSASYNGYYFPMVRWFNAPCPFTGFGAPDGARYHAGIPSTGQCATGKPPPDDLAPISVIYPYLLPRDVLRLQAMHPYDLATDGPPDLKLGSPPDPGLPVVENRLQQRLDADGSDFLREWIEYELAADPDPSFDPLRTGLPAGDDPDDACRLSPPADELDTTTAAFDEKVHFLRTDPGTGKMVATSLRWGVALADDATHDFSGWGFRKVSQRHGWTQADEDATAIALQSTPVARPHPYWKSMDLMYTGPEYTPDGTDSVCARTVVVRTSIDGALGETEARLITTSYGRLLRAGAP